MRIVALILAVTIPIFCFSFGVIGSFLFTFTVPLFWEIGIRERTPASLGLTRIRLPRAIFSGLITGIVFGLLGGGILVLLGLTGHSIENATPYSCSFGSFTYVLPLEKELCYRILTMEDSLLSTLTYLTFSIFLIGLGEEIFWRGFLQKKIIRRIGRHRGVLATSLVFAAVHVYLFAIAPLWQAMVFIGIIGLAGALWGYLYLFQKTIWGVALSHGIAAFLVWKFFFFSG
ncbi:MAG: CPBP family intramembrane metalloprotease [Candidatus Omnitrophica bacterium]|nr:CPBP family intramembrane metalloprotease [Candidatus Omnitrophota bacterium]